MSAQEKRSPLTYARAGVDIDAGEALVGRIKSMVKKTHRPEVLGDIGGFGGLFSIANTGRKDPVLVSSTDGVGTKLKIAIAMNDHSTIGQDLVAMVLNDIIVCGAEPLFLLDYFATGRLEVDAAEQVIAGIAEGCQRARTALLGGETAEMPGFYPDGHYDLAGFGVGVVDRGEMIDGERVQPGHKLIGIASSGIHSNGLSLARAALGEDTTALTATPDGWNQTVGAALLTPTRIYVSTVLDLLKDRAPLDAISHITGGGVVDNLPRVLPKGTAARINSGAWERPAIFKLIQQRGNVPDAEMWRTFNMGIGLILAVPAGDAASVQNTLRAAGESSWVIGEVAEATGNVRCTVD